MARSLTHETVALPQPRRQAPGGQAPLREGALLCRSRRRRQGRFIQALLGHESLETTQTYTKVSIAKLAEIHAATHPGAKLARDKAMLDAALDAEDGEAGDEGE
jgi:hypothetical protein